MIPLAAPTHRHRQSRLCSRPGSHASPRASATTDVTHSWRQASGRRPALSSPRPPARP
jgi:hypothetical protein